MDTDIRLIVGLGNPGPRYVNTRHNLGMRLLEQLGHELKGTWVFEKKFPARILNPSSRLTKVSFIIPETYMNHSGQALSAYAHYYKISVAEILVVHDELDLQPGCCRFKTGGGHGGHNGLRDIIHHLGSADFHRLRLGIGHPGDKSLVVDYVLGTTSKTDETALSPALNNASAILLKILKEPAKHAFSEFNQYFSM